MNIIERLKNKVGLTILLVCFGLVELTNFESLFFKFMTAFRPDWGAFNHIASLFLSFGLLSAIIVYGMRREALISWGLAVLAIIISLGVYSQISTISWNWGDWHMENLAVVILGVVCPLMVAHTTHRIANDDDEAEDEFEIEAEIKRREKKLKMRRKQVEEAPTLSDLPLQVDASGNINGSEFTYFDKYYGEGK